MLKRILPVFFTVFLFILCSAVSVSAEGVDYTDYIVNVFEQDGVNMVQVSIPASELGPGAWYVRPYPYDSASRFEGHSFTYHFLEDTTYRLSYYPFQGNYGLIADDIPSGTHMSISVYGTEVGLDGYSTPKYRWIMIYRDADENNLSDVWTDPDEFGFVNSENWKIFTVEKPVNTAYLYFYIDFIDFEILPDFASADSTIGIKSLDMVMTLDSLYLQQIQSGKTNKILCAVESHLAEQGKILADMVNGKVDPEKPAGSDKVDDYNKAESELIDSVQGGSTEFDDVSLNAWDRIFTYSQSFMAFGLIFKLFTDIPIIESLLYVSLTLGAFAFMLNLTSALGSKLSRDSSRSQAAVRYRVSIENRRRRHG